MILSKTKHQNGILNENKWWILSPEIFVKFTTLADQPAPIDKRRVVGALDWAVSNELLTAPCENESGEEAERDGRSFYQEIAFV